ncbi:trehalose-phosphatase [Qipengyuania sp. MTN3-11]|uniref:trehalose-phosphatase n=1 Tax=Qipengyuania sp. MTN3-11 TaxID=3056557 RepID=UPI0036F33D29
MAATLPPPPALDTLLAERKVALFLDFDGTLVDIAPTPDEIDVPGDLVARLHALCERMDHRVALVSGRALDDLEAHLPAIRVCRAGSHGASRLLADGARLGKEPTGLPDGAVAELRAFAEREGLLYETKAHGGALHFRQSPDSREAAVRRGHEIADAFGLDLFTGKGIVELVRPGANKGEAVRAFMETASFADALPVFLGDDTTDEDGMEAVRAYGGFGIAVGERESAMARYALDSVAAVHHWLGL